MPSLSQSSYSVWISSDSRPGVDSPVSPSISTATSNSSRVTPRSSLKSKNLNASSLLMRPFSSILHWIMAYMAAFQLGGATTLDPPVSAFCFEGLSSHTWSTPTASPWWFM